MTDFDRTIVDRCHAPQVATLPRFGHDERTTSRAIPVVALVRD